MSRISVIELFAPLESAQFHMMYHVRRYVNYNFINEVTTQTCGIETFKLRKLSLKFQQLFVVFHEILFSYHGQI